METLIALTCPNCGAGTTNHKNCEYCGSLLVRFVEQKIDLKEIDYKSYTSNVKVLPGLINALQENFIIQKENRNALVVTDINKKISTIEAILGHKTTLAYVVSNLQKSNKKSFFTEADDGQPHLMVAFDFLGNDSVQVKKYKKFKNLDCFNLFTNKRNTYIIDFGRDIEGAARILSKVLREVFNVGNGENLEYFTTFGNDTKEIEKKRKQKKSWYERYSWLIAIAFFVLALIWRSLKN